MLSKMPDRDQEDCQRLLDDLLSMNVANVDRERLVNDLNGLIRTLAEPEPER
jgi:hypothetical protein